jgi:hypothetical protein
MNLGNIMERFDGDTQRGRKKSLENWLRAGVLGCGQAFLCLSQSYIKRRNWDEARRYLRKGADLMSETAVANRGCKASLGGRLIWKKRFDFIGRRLDQEIRMPVLDWDDAILKEKE